MPGGDNGRVPTSAEPPARHEATAREVARRRAVDMLRLAESIAGYAAAQLANGLGPAEARAAALDAAVELDAVAGKLRRLAVARLDAAERRALAVELAGSGMSPRQIAGRIGVAPSTVCDYLSGRSGMGGRSAPRLPFGDERAPSGPGFYQPLVGERRERFADGPGGYAEFLRERGGRRHPGSGRVVARGDPAAHGRRDLLARRFR
jgi:hypothetical protein